MKIKQSKGGRKRASVKSGRPDSVNRDAKKREEFWSDPCWQQPAGALG